MPDISAIVTSFFARRAAGERLSVDALLADFTPGGATNAFRSSLIDELARTARQQSRAPQSGSGSWDFPSPPSYDIIDQIGAGGMGVVYEAYQRSTGRRVALKFPHADQDRGPVALARFEREIELAARLSHPGIVQVLDSGRCEGRPFVALEFVEGQELGEALPSGRAAVPEILAALAEIADAVEYAHQRGILHRDLKPSNVLRDERGRYRLLDFGLAKEIATDPAMVKQTLSHGGQLLGTLAYMAPEQARGQASEISVRTDIYALGAILYELLTGRPPVEPSAALPDVLSRIVAGDFAAPSRRRAAVRADVDAITLKCLARSPAARYASAAELRDDLRRCLAHQPIRARPLSALSRMGRLMRRNAAVSVTAGAALVALLAVSGASLARILHERDRSQTAALEARQRLQDARDALEFLTEQVREELEPRGNTGPLRRAILSGVYERLARLATQTPSPLLQTDLARVQTQAARLALELGNPEDAAHKIADALKTLRDPQLDAFAHERDPALGMALKVAGDISLARGERHAAQTAFDEAYELFHRLHSERPRDSEALRGLSLMAERYALIAVQQQDAVADRRWTEEMLARKRDVLAVDDSPLARSELAIALERLAKCMLKSRELDSAEPVIVESLGLREALVASRPEHRRFLRGLSQSYEQMAELASLRGLRDQDRAWTAKMADAKRALLRLDPLGWLSVHDMAVTLERLAVHARVDGDLEKSATLRVEAVEHYRALLQQQPDARSVLADLALCQRDSLATLMKLARFEAADANAREILALVSEKDATTLSAGDRLEVQVAAQICLTLCASQGGRRAEAREWVQAALVGANELVERHPRHERARVLKQSAEDLRTSLMTSEPQ